MYEFSHQFAQRTEGAIKEERLMREDEMEEECDFFFAKYHEFKQQSNNFEDIIMKHALIKNKNINQTAFYLYKFLNVRNHFNFFQSITYYSKLTSNPKALLMKEILRFVNDQKELDKDH